MTAQLGTDVDRQIDGQPPAAGDAYGPHVSAIGVLGPTNLRAEFGAHLEANYPRLVAQLCMITLDTGRAHELVQDAYARAWQRWSTVREMPDPTGWIRHLAVRASSSWWRRLRQRLRPTPGPAIEDPGQAAVMQALGKLSLYLRRPLVLADVAHLGIEEVARVENIVPVLVNSRVTRARDEFTRALSTQSGVETGPGAPWERM